MLQQPNEAYKPFTYPWAMQAAVESEQAHWGEWEAELQSDVNQWKTTLTEAEKSHITSILRLFTQSDTQVASNYCDFFIPVFRNNEVRCMLLSFAAREGVHQRAYALLNDTLGLPEVEYQAFLKYKELKDKIEFMQQSDISTKAGIAKALALTVCNEGLSLFSAFTMLINYQRFGKMIGMCKIVEWSIRDETHHVNSMCMLFKEFCREHPRVVTDALKRDIYLMYTRSVELEDAVIDLAYAQGDTEGLTAAEVKSYIRYIADRRLTQLGLKPIFESTEENPLPWLDWVVNGQSHSNFFEQRVTDYSKEPLTGSWQW